MRGSTPKVQDYNSIIKLLEENQIVLKEDVLNTNEAIEISQFDYMEVSYLPIYAQAGYLNHFNQNMLIEDNLPTPIGSITQLELLEDLYLAFSA